MNQNFDILNSVIENNITLIDSSAGTGKTFTIASLIPRLLLEGVVSDISKLLVVTFTNAAAQELAERIRQRLNEVLLAFEQGCSDDPVLQGYLDKFPQRPVSIIRRAITAIDEAGIYTIHGFCKKMLSEAAFESGMPLECEFTQSEDSHIRQCAADFWRQHIYHSPLLASFVASYGITPQSLVNEFKTYRNHSDCVLLPRAASLEEVCSATEHNLSELKQRWNEEAFLNYLQNLPTLSTAKNNKAAQALADPVSIAEKITHALTSDNLSLILAAISSVSEESICNAIKSKKDKEDFQAHPFSTNVSAVTSALSSIHHSLRSEFSRQTSALLTDLKQEQNVMAFHDLLSMLHAALTDRTSGNRLCFAIRGKFEAALIDEFQDTDSLQLEIFTRLFQNHRPLYFIGDPKQAIYSFRGADIFSYIQAAKMSQNRCTLGKNWRSAPNVVDAVNTIFSARSDSFVFDDINFDPASAAKDNNTLTGDSLNACHWLFLEDTDTTLTTGVAAKNAAAACAAEISNIVNSNTQLDRRDVSCGDIAVLVRSNHQAKLVQHELQALSIPSIISNNEKITDSDEFREIELVLRFISDNRSTAALATALWGFEAERIHDIINDESAWSELTEATGNYRKLWQRYGASAMLQELFEQNNVLARLLQVTGGERKLTNYRHVLEIIQQGPAAPQALLQWLERRRHDEGGEEDEIRLETDRQAVQISTIHKSKGLEYNIVFCPFLWQAVRKTTNRPPVLAHSDNALVYDFGSDNFEKHAEQAYLETLSEDLRILYVALTRAVNRLYIIWGEVKDCENSALGWLLQDAGSISEFIDNNKCVFSSSVAGNEAKAYMQRQEDMDFSPVYLEFARSDKLYSWHTTSFSGLTRNSHHSKPTGRPPQTEQLNPMLAFGRGKSAPPANETGTALHEILENIDLADPDSEVIEKILSRYGLLSKEAHSEDINPTDTIMQMLECVAMFTPQGCTVTLSQITDSIKEMPFTLPLRDINFPSCIDQAFSAMEEYRKYLNSLEQSVLEGYLTGIIDAVIHHGGKWYIIDWKSNFLGAAPDDYSPSAIATSMYENHYVLQYMLYTIALKRHLQLRSCEFDYAQNFGGVYYCFLRGLDNTGNGWYHHKPEANVIETMERALFE